LVDFKNAFNMVGRQRMLEEVHRLFSGLFAWVQYSYGVGATLFSGSDMIYATSGVQQGDPLGPLLFSLVLHPLLEKLKSDFSLRTVAFLDDVTLHGPAENVNQALSWLSSVGPNSGLHVSASKTVVWSPSGSLRAFQDRGMFSGFQCSSEAGVELLGGAVSQSQVFIGEVVEKRVGKCIESLHRMMALEDPQLCLLLLRACEGMPKLVYCWRTVCPDYLQEQSARFELELVGALRRITVADGPHFGEFQVSLSTLPVTLGGLGIQLPSDILNFAFVASAIESNELQRGILGLESSDFPPWVPEMVASYARKVFRDDPAQATQLSESLLMPQPNLQLFMARRYFERRRDELMNHSYITRQDQNTRRRFEGILASTVQKDASSWLFAMPNGGMGQRMTPLEFQAAVSFRLLMPQFEPGWKCCQNRCGANLDVFGYHALVCRGHFLPRHNLVRDALFDLTLKARFAPVKDAPVTCLGYRSGQPTAFRPADLLVAGDDFDRDCLDVTVVSPLVTGNQPEVVVGKKAAEAQRMKIRKHQEACEASGFGFKAFAVDVFGVLAEDSSRFMSRVCQRLIREADYPSFMASAICYRKISFAVQLGVARQYIACRKPQEVKM
jgi:ubiquitin carboxyl-terminal hydrolase 44/49